MSDAAAAKIKGRPNHLERPSNLNAVIGLFRNSSQAFGGLFDGLRYYVVAVCTPAATITINASL